MAYKYGKKEHVPGAVRWKYRDIFDRRKLQKAPLVFGHVWNRTPIPMLGNNLVGNCVWCTQAHLLQAMQRGLDKPETVFTPESVINDYAVATSYTPGDPSTDNGTGMADGAKYWRQIGIHDADGVAHQITAYCELKIDDPDELMQAAFDFGGVALGVQFPKSAEKQWDSGKPLTREWRKSEIVGGHAMTLLGRNHHGDAVIATWDGITSATMEWIDHYTDEALAFVSLSYLDERGVNPRGYDKTELEKMLAGLQK
jgi:hypothetical protein